MNNSPSNIFQPLLALEKYHQDSPTVLAATVINGLRMMTSVCGLVLVFRKASTLGDPFCHVTPTAMSYLTNGT